MTGDLKQIPDTNRIELPSAGLTRRGGSVQNEASSGAHRLPVGEAALPAASPQIANPSLCSLIQTKETSKDECICPGTALGKPRVNRAHSLLMERGRAWYTPAKGRQEEGDGLKGSTLLYVGTMCEGDMSTFP